MLESHTQSQFSIKKRYKRPALKRGDDLGMFKMESVTSLVLWRSSKSWSEVKDGSWPKSSRHRRKSEDDMFTRMIMGQTAGPVTCMLSQDGGVLEVESDAVWIRFRVPYKRSIHLIYITVTLIDRY